MHMYVPSLLYSHSRATIKIKHPFNYLYAMHIIHNHPARHVSRYPFGLKLLSYKLYDEAKVTTTMLLIYEFSI